MSADRQTGIIQKSFGQIAVEVGYTENNQTVTPHKMVIKRAIEWMEKKKMLVTACDGELVTGQKKITICNWGTYQATSSQPVTACDGELVTPPINKEVQEVQDKNKTLMSANADVQKIFDQYQAKIKTKSRLTDSAKKKIQTRLKTFSTEELEIAITNFSNHEWNMANNSHRGIAWFFNSDDRIDGFLNLEPDAPQKSADEGDDLYERFEGSGARGPAKAQASAPVNGKTKIGSPPSAISKKKESNP